MNPVRRELAVFALLLLAVTGSSQAGSATIGLLLSEPGSFDGYTLFGAQAYGETFLIDNNGMLLHSWLHADLSGTAAYLLPDGRLSRGAWRFSPYFIRPGQQGLLQEYDWDGNLLWEFEYSDSTHRHHHDHEPLPNGNLLIVAWELKTFDEAIAAGRNPATLADGELWPEHIVELEPVGANGANIVWEWHAWDHLVQDFDATKDNFGVVADHPELINLNYTNGSFGPADWLHANAIAYDAALDQIVLSVNVFNEFWIIDHGTTTAEAAGHTGGARGKGGDILYRWGNPEAYDRGTAADRNNYRQHSVHWIPPGSPGAGNILFFNNGNGRPEGTYSTVEELQTTVDAGGDYPDPPPSEPHGPAAATWVFQATPPESLYGQFQSGAQRLPNGNTLICEGPTGTFYEVDTSDQIIWVYVNPVNGDGPMIQGTPPTGNIVFRVTRYAPEYSAFDGRDLTPRGPIEIYPTTGVQAASEGPLRFALEQNFPNPVRPVTTIGFSLGAPSRARLDVYDVRGRHVTMLVDQDLPAGSHSTTWRTSGFPSGVYYYTLRVGATSETRKMIVLN